MGKSICRKNWKPSAHWKVAQKQFRNEMIERGNNVAYARSVDNYHKPIRRRRKKKDAERKRIGTLASVKIDDIVYLLAHSALSFNKNGSEYIITHVVPTSINIYKCSFTPVSFFLSSCSDWMCEWYWIFYSIQNHSVQALKIYLKKFIMFFSQSQATRLADNGWPEYSWINLRHNKQNSSFFVMRIVVSASLCPFSPMQNRENV